MLLNMHFSLGELHFIFSEIRRVLKPKDLNFFSVRNHNDKSYGKSVEIDKGIYDINGFQIRFFTEWEIQELTAEGGFEILWIKEEYEEPVTLYLVHTDVASLKVNHNIIKFRSLYFLLCTIELYQPWDIEDILFIIFMPIALLPLCCCCDFSIVFRPVP
jgi:hypothetical protein